jgi:hypothetical protein
LILGGDKVEVLEPEALRREIAGELARAAAKYGRDVSERSATLR